MHRLYSFFNLTFPFTYCYRHGRRLGVWSSAYSWPKVATSQAIHMHNARFKLSCASSCYWYLFYHIAITAPCLVNVFAPRAQNAQLFWKMPPICRCRRIGRALATLSNASHNCSLQQNFVKHSSTPRPRPIFNINDDAQTKLKPHSVLPCIVTFTFYSGANSKRTAACEI